MRWRASDAKDVACISSSSLTYNFQDQKQHLTSFFNMLVPSLKTIVTLGVAFYATIALAIPVVELGADVQDLSERNEALEQPAVDAVSVGFQSKAFREY
ncbi:hypothetical protein CORC01_02707 [Colletotrichum orchidophilum]|uniref:Uncharacterized protein n=1 Tax=Colletotrichum orchidophilum TaxID=1209926 RepID=A0A1G4BLF1_9PEZI|nr:uncharacterized protein CORC01_02707 [Colletotrichum orchidophilum]OHF02128.1 hypothetical protein CORC01_02707 [Colletotrichum orchidophilum]